MFKFLKFGAVGEVRKCDVGIRVHCCERFSAMLQGKSKVLETAEAETADPYLEEVRKNWGEKYSSGREGSRPARPNAATASGKNRRWVAIVPDRIITWDNTKIPAWEEKRRREREQRQAEQ